MRETSTGCLFYTPHTPTRDKASNPSICPDWEVTWWPLALLYDAQPTAPHWLWLHLSIMYTHSFSPQKTSWKTFASTLMSTIYQAPQVIRMYIELCKALWQWAASQMIWYKPLWESINTLFLMCWIEDRWIDRNMNMRVCFSEL